jgi:hypothetical protein
VIAHPPCGGVTQPIGTRARRGGLIQTKDAARRDRFAQRRKPEGTGAVPAGEDRRSPRTQQGAAGEDRRTAGAHLRTRGPSKPPKTPTNSSVPPSREQKANVARGSGKKSRKGRPGVTRELCPNPDVTRNIYIEGVPTADHAAASIIWHAAFQGLRSFPAGVLSVRWLNPSPREAAECDAS